MKKYESLLHSKDAEIKELQEKHEKQNDSITSLEKKLQELENTANSKDGDLAALRLKMEEMEQTFEKESGEYEKILSSKGEEVLGIKEKIKEKDVTIVSHESRMKELENIINKRDDEIARMRKKFESEVSSKDKELKECLQSMNSRAQEVTELKGTIEEMQKVISSNEKKLEECTSVINLKDVEIGLLTGTEGASRANGIKCYESALRNKDDEILELKKKIEEEQHYLMEKGKELEDYRNNMNLKTNEVAVLKRKLEENNIPVPKGDELRECEIKDMKIFELEECVDKLREELESKDKEIEDYKNIVSLKQTEVNLLKDKIEESEVTIPKSKELSDSEAIVKSREQSIARLKKEVEEHRKTIFFKDKDLEECRNNLNTKEQELVLLREKLEDHEVVIPKNVEMKEYKKSFNAKEAEIMRLKKKIEEQQESVTSKEERIQELETTIEKGGEILITKDSKIDELEKQISDLKCRNKKSKDAKTKDDSNIIKSQEMEIANLNEKIDKLNKTISTKDMKVKEDISIIKSQEELVANLKGMIGRLNKSVAEKESLIKELRKKIKIKEEMVSSKDPEVRKLHPRISQCESNKPEDGCISVQEKGGSRKSEEMPFPFDKEFIAIQKKIAEAGNKARDSKTPEWQNVIKLVQESSEMYTSQQAKIASLQKKYDDLVEKLEESKNEIEQTFNKKFEEQEASLSKKNAEIKALEDKLAEEKSNQEELKKKVEEQEDSVAKKNAEVKELELKLSEEAKSKEKYIFIENQTKILGDLVMVLQQVEFQWYSRISNLEDKLLNFKGELSKKNVEVQEIISEAKKEKERERQKAEEEKERWRVQEEKERLKSEEEKERLRAEAEKERQRAEEEKQRWEAEEKRRNERVEKEIQTEKCEIEKYEREVQTEICESEKVEVDSEEEGSVKMSDADAPENCHKSEGSLFNKTQASFTEQLSWLLQKIELLASGSIVRLDKENRIYCRKLLCLSEELHAMKTKLSAAEETIRKGNLYKKQKLEQDSKKLDSKLKSEQNSKKIEPEQDSGLQSKNISLEGSPESVHLIQTLQRIECVCTRNAKRHSQHSLRLLQRNSVLAEQVQASNVELTLATQEIERKDQEYCSCQGLLRKKEARILCLELELAETKKNISSLESKSKMQLLEEQTQHGIEVEQVIALKRQAETDYRSLERKFMHTSLHTEEFTQRRKQAGITEESNQRKKQTRPPRYKGRKRTSTEQDQDFEPFQKRRMIKKNRPVDLEDEDISNQSSLDKDFEPSRKRRTVKKPVYFEDENLSTPGSAGAGTSHITETPSSFQRLQEYVAEKSPVIKAVAHRVATFLNPKSGCEEDNNSSTIKKRKKKLFNSSCAPPLVGSPVHETIEKISPKKVVNRKFRNKKDPK